MLVKALIVLLLLTLPSCKKNQEWVLVIADNGKINKESAADVTGLWESVVGNLMFTPLSYVDNDLVMHNLLAEEVRVLPDGKTIEIGIRQGVRFHDGKEMTARDVAVSINRTIKTNKSLKERYGLIVAANVGKLKITITGDKPLSELNGLLPNLFVSSKNLTGTGPYRFHNWLENGVELIANDDYFEGTPKLKRIDYRYEPDERKRVSMLLKGEVDLLVWLSPEMAGFLKKDGRFYVNELAFEFYTALFLNNESPLFRDKILRQALSMAINRDELIKKVLKGGGKKISVPLPHQLINPEKNAGSSDYRPREAARLLKDAGWSDGDGDGILEKNGKKLRFRLYYNSEAEEFRKMADLISQDLFEIGIGVETVPVSTGGVATINLASGNYGAILDTSVSQDSVSRVKWSSSSIYNISRFHSSEMDNLLDRLGETADVEQKKAIYSKMQRVFEEEVPAAFLYSPVTYTAVNRKFKGAEEFVGSVYSIYKIKDWSIR